MTERARDTTVIDGIAYILPRGEGRPRWVRRIGAYVIGCSCRWTSFNIGVDVLKAGILVAIGPMFFFAARIEPALPTPPSPSPDMDKDMIDG